MATPPLPGEDDDIPLGRPTADRHRRVGLIGLGEIGLTHLTALSHLADGNVEVVGGFDPRAPADNRVREYRSLEALVADVDTVVIGTPTAAHAEVCRSVLAAARSPLVLLVEKPLATTMGEVASLVAEATTTGCELEVLYHLAYSPEVVWGRAVWESIGRSEGAVDRVEAHFSDLVSPDEVGWFREVYGSSWIDLGINALSVLAGFVRVDALMLEDRDDKASSYRGSLSFSNGAHRGKGSVTTAWMGDEKWTSLQFHSGAELLLDHQRMSGRLLGTSTELSFEAEPSVPRLICHYVPMFTDILIGRRRLFSPAEDLALHRMLLDAVR